MTNSSLPYVPSEPPKLFRVLELTPLSDNSHCYKVLIADIVVTATNSPLYPHPMRLFVSAVSAHPSIEVKSFTGDSWEEIFKEAEIYIAQLIKLRIQAEQNYKALKELLWTTPPV